MMAARAYRYTRRNVYRTRKLSALLSAVGVLSMMARREASSSRAIITEMPVLGLRTHKRSTHSMCGRA